MGKEPSEEDSLYGRVLHRLSQALEEAERVAAAGEAGDAELEVRGLTPAEFELIRAYLQRDSQWLSGWHAAAEEQEHLSRQALRPSLRSVPRGRHGGRGKHVPLSLQQTLSCALCNSEVHWPEGPGPAICPVCGSQLLRARQRLFSYRRH
ncbi:hypothetical protein N8H22_01605 [Stutzerimonas stutzeri]|jgi:predicted RNA-binding Zn-ribbon protein involved in translation (DUF1610 family)|uniref:hypothetical protein n=1 Tax=Stutzerimonas sp. S1 TaxID=3030652 RepID=UPI0022255489|nr:hypothetical protein [Stutzerimonas sp. S1]MCW3147294.1 hypothetical protein [Stutzerimonas sp. S1]